MNEPNPFLDPSRQQELYGHASRLAGRTSALMRAKTSGRPVPETIVSLVQAHHAQPDHLRLVLDIGCGRGTSSLVIGEQLRPRRVVGLDAAPSLLAQARERAKDLPDTTLDFIEGDFHDLPLPAGSCDVAVAAFCLYHSPRPQDVIAQITTVLAPGGLAVLVTKGLDSYREMDQLVASAGLDARADKHESLYTAAHSGNLAGLAASSLDVIAIEDEEHTFTFGGNDHLTQYLATNPKYDLAPGLYGNPGALAATLHEFLPDQPLTTRSLITFVVAQPRGGPA
ncbi:class I SAM-dependent methyltransferase [Streptomyces sp. NBC_01221]|uniref:class I SAM-dependent methyltransferase n=1 Tax=Streptomyces sp. NBC_01221 TaxID=2903782 RepID=UPI00224CD55E|nr:class I SAM-dependent methyltransferase [Streptomyces sp. NBC_01221]MCX4785420.1 class I SAM-dependent methyltransferase [Streptomyces sp. NBC_01221]